MTRTEKAARVAELRAQGWVHREIADHLGISISYSIDLANDPDGRKMAARKRGYSGSCLDCGKPTSGSNGRQAAPDRCSPCANAHGKIWTKEKIVQTIQEQVARLGVTTLVVNDVRESIPSLLTSAQREFGSWRAAVEAAGFPAMALGERRDPEAWRAALLLGQATHGPRGPYKWTREAIIDALRSVSRDGTAPVVATVGNACYLAACREFGGWREACDAAGLRWTARGGRVRMSTHTQAFHRREAVRRERAALLGEVAA